MHQGYALGTRLWELYNEQQPKKKKKKKKSKSSAPNDLILIINYLTSVYKEYVKSIIC